jgi:hypothetical protein
MSRSLRQIAEDVLMYSKLMSPGPWVYFVGTSDGHQALPPLVCDDNCRGVAIGVGLHQRDEHDMEGIAVLRNHAATLAQAWLEADRRLEALLGARSEQDSERGEDEQDADMLGCGGEAARPHQHAEDQDQDGEDPPQP